MSGHSKWSTIKRQKGTEDQRRGLTFSKLSRAISVAAKNGADPESDHCQADRDACQHATDAQSFVVFQEDGRPEEECIADDDQRETDVSRAE